MTDVDIRLSGPLFDGRAARIMETAGHEAEQEVGLAAAEALRARVNREAKHPSGRFASRITVDRRRGDGARVHTPGLVYDTWLQGVSRRNQTSRFKGYQLFRDARQEIATRAPAIAGEVIRRRVKELNG